MTCPRSYFSSSTHVLCFLFDVPSNNSFSSYVTWSQYASSVSFCKRTQTFFQRTNIDWSPTCHCSRHKFMHEFCSSPTSQATWRAKMLVSRVNREVVPLGCHHCNNLEASLRPRGSGDFPCICAVIPLVLGPTAMASDQNSGIALSPLPSFLCWGKEAIFWDAYTFSVNSHEPGQWTATSHPHLQASIHLVPLREDFVAESPSSLLSLLFLFFPSRWTCLPFPQNPCSHTCLCPVPLPQTPPSELLSCYCYITFNSVPFPSTKAIHVYRIRDT